MQYGFFWEHLTPCVTSDKRRRGNMMDTYSGGDSFCPFTIRLAHQEKTLNCSVIFLDIRSPGCDSAVVSQKKTLCFELVENHL